MILSITWFEIIYVIILDLKVFSWITESVAGAAAAAAVNSNGIRILEANGLSTLFINSKPFLSNGIRKIYLKNLLIVLFYARIILF